MIAVFDTCVVLDYLLDRSPFADNSEELVLQVADGVIDGLITVKSVMDIHYVLKHCLHDEKKTRQVIETLIDSFTLVDSAADDAVKALTSETNDYEDALMIETAIACHADCMITRNVKDYKKCPIPVLSPDAFLKKYHK
ncbi:MAG: PIN domain-containing protein [Solobacterium sp.]|nr:PIN domain-containing protein [Solobacterium sp.]